MQACIVNVFSVIITSLHIMHSSSCALTITFSHILYEFLDVNIPLAPGDYQELPASVAMYPLQHEDMGKPI